MPIRPAPWVAWVSEAESSDVSPPGVLRHALVLISGWRVNGHVRRSKECVNPSRRAVTALVARKTRRGVPVARDAKSAESPTHCRYGDDVAHCPVMTWHMARGGAGVDVLLAPRV